jgi:hypothetical protein
LAIADPAHRQLGDLAWAEDDGKLLAYLSQLTGFATDKSF